MKMKILYLLIGISAFTLCRAQSHPSLTLTENLLTADGKKDTLTIYNGKKLAIFREMVHDPPLRVLIRLSKGTYTAKYDTLRLIIEIKE